MHFNRFYKNTKEICQVDKFQANYQTITFHDDIFGQTAKAIAEVRTYSVLFKGFFCLSHTHTHTHTHSHSLSLYSRTSQYMLSVLTTKVLT